MKVFEEVVEIFCVSRKQAVKKVESWGTFAFAGKIEEYFQFFTYTLWENDKEPLGPAFSHLSFEMAKCCSMFKLGVTNGHIFHCFYAKDHAGHLKKANSGF